MSWKFSKILIIVRRVEGVSKISYLSEHIDGWSPIQLSDQTYSLVKSSIVEGRWLLLLLLCWYLPIDNVSTSCDYGTCISVSYRDFRFESVLISLIDVWKIENKLTCWSDVEISWQN